MICDIRHSATTRGLVLLVIFVLELSCGVTGNIQSAHACSPSSSFEGQCTQFDISCSTNKRILIREAQHGYRYKDVSNCLNTLPCTIDNCCPIRTDDKTVVFDIARNYDLYKACSWKQTCTTKSSTGSFGKQASKYSLLDYECVKEKPMVNFCQDGEITGNSINIIFDRQNIRYSLPSECVCKVTMSDPKTSYRLSAPDLRLMSEYENCSSKATVYGPNDIHIRCSDKFTKGDSTKIPVNPVEVKLSFQHPPEFVWIKLDADVTNSVSQNIYHRLSVQCYKPYQTTAPITTTTTTTDTATAETSPSKKFPIIAVIIPVVIIVVMVVVVVLIILWRRRNRNKDKSLQPEKESKDKPDRGLPKPASEPYDKLFPLEGVPRTSDNYIELDPENTYATIDPDYVSRKTEDGVRREDTTTVINPDTPSGGAKYDTDKSVMSSVNKGKDHLSKDTKQNPPHLNLVQKTSHPYYNTDNQGYTSNEQTQPIHSEEETPSYYVLKPHNQ